MPIIEQIDKFIVKKTEKKKQKQGKRAPKEIFGEGARAPLRAP